MESEIIELSMWAVELVSQVPLMPHVLDFTIMVSISKPTTQTTQSPLLLVAG